MATIYTSNNANELQYSAKEDLSLGIFAKMRKKSRNFIADIFEQEYYAESDSQAYNAQQAQTASIVKIVIILAVAMVAIKFIKK